MAVTDIIELTKPDTGERFYPLTHAAAVIGLGDSQFFETHPEDGGGISIHLKSEYSGLWTDGFLSAGGINSSSSGGGGEGSTVTWTQLVDTGTQIATISINGVTTDVYAPVGGGGGGGTVGTLNTNNSTAQSVSSSESFAGTIKLHKVSKTGNYNDLLNRPTIPAAPVQSDWWQTDSTALDFIKNKPTIPTVNNATMTIQMNGTAKGTFSANASSNVTIDLGSVITSHQSLTNYVTKTGADTIRGEKTMRAGLIIDGANSGYLQVNGWSNILSAGGTETLADALAGRDNIIESVKVNGSTLPITNKSVNVSVPVSGTDFLSPSSIASTYQTKLTAGTDYLTAAAIASAYLPLTGGTLAKGGANVLTVQNTGANNTQILMRGPSNTLGAIEWSSDWGFSISANNTSGVFRGKLGIQTDGSPYYADATYNQYALFHTGNWKDNAVLDLKSIGMVPANTNLNDLVDPSKGNFRGWFRFYSNVLHKQNSTVAAVNGFPTTNDANAMISIDTYNDGTNLGLYQIGFSGNGNIYYRNSLILPNPLSGGNWNRLVAEDHNGDVSIGGHLTIPQGKELRFGSSSGAYITKNPADGNLYINAGQDANNTGRALVFFEASAFMPSAGANLGADWLMWNNLHAKRWYPKANDYTVYIEWDSDNDAFKIVGNVYSTGQVAAGGIISNS